MYRPNEFQSAIEDFYAAQRKARIQEILTRWRGKPVDLLSFEEVRQKLKAVQGPNVRKC